MPKPYFGGKSRKTLPAHRKDHLNENHHSSFWSFWSTPFDLVGPANCEDKNNGLWIWNIRTPENLAARPTTRRHMKWRGGGKKLKYWTSQVWNVANCAPANSSVPFARHSVCLWLIWNRYPSISVDDIIMIFDRRIWRKIFATFLSTLPTKNVTGPPSPPDAWLGRITNSHLDHYRVRILLCDPSPQPGVSKPPVAGVGGEVASPSLRNIMWYAWISSPRPLIQEDNEHICPLHPHSLYG
jgi:hypothetical protein